MNGIPEIQRKIEAPKIAPENLKLWDDINELMAKATAVTDLLHESGNLFVERPNSYGWACTLLSDLLEQAQDKQQKLLESLTD